MKKIILTFIFIIIFSWMSFVTLSVSRGESALSEGQTAVVTKVKGEVAVQFEGGAWEYVTTKRVVSGGTQIWTLNDSAAKISFPDGTEFSLFANSNLFINVLKKSDNQSTSLFNMVYGKLKATVQSITGSDSKFEVETPTSVASIRGTDFEIEVDQDEKGEPVTKVNVIKGVVEVASVTNGLLGNLSQIMPGNSAVIQADGVVTHFEYLLPLLDKDEMKLWMEYQVENQLPIHIPFPW